MASLTLNDWASVVTILSLPLIIISFFVGYHELKKILERPDISLEMTSPGQLGYQIKNNSKIIAEDVLISFGIFDLDNEPNKPLPLISKNTNFINAKSGRGPFQLLDTHGVESHRYFGIIYLSCRNMKSLKTYWVYFKQGDKGSSFFAERNSNDTYNIDLKQLVNNTEEYLNKIITVNRRIIIK